MKRLFLSLILLGLSYFLLAQVNLEATGEGSTAELARQAAISELSYQISAQVKSRSESRQQLKNDQFEEATSQSVVIQSDLPLLGNRIEITSLPNTYRATARLESKAALPLYLTRIAELNQDLQSAKEDPLKWEIFSAKARSRTVHSKAQSTQPDGYIPAPHRGKVGVCLPGRRSQSPLRKWKEPNRQQ